MTFASDVASQIQACKAAKSSSKKGEALQKLVEYVFGQAAGYEVVDTRKINVFRSEEVDLSLYQNPALSGAHFIDAFFLVECKNRASRLPAAEVSWFAAKVRNRGQNFGILVALRGISGKASGPTAAHQIIQTALRDGTRIIVVTEDDLLALSKPDGVTELIKAKLGGLLTAYEI